MNEPIVFVDTETTGLDPDQHEVWEVALIAPNEVFEARIRPSRLTRADPTALRLTHYYDRIVAAGGPGRFFTDERNGSVAWAIARITSGMHLVGAVPSFDARFLEAFLRSEGYTPAWHYHLIDVETLVAGQIGLAPPWDSEDLSRRVGVQPGLYDRHTALGDAQWARALYQTVFAGG